MDRLARLDWSLLESFAAVGEHGSLSAAARAIGASQPTLSRHITTLEHRVGARLFEREASGVALTATGAALMAHAKDMANAASKLSMAMDGRAESLKGCIRLTASQIMASYVLPSVLTKLRMAEPDIDIELVASDKTENLLRREADIAIRMYRPTQEDVITRKIGNLRMGMYASRSYIERHGLLGSIEDIGEHTIIGYDRSTQIIEGFKEAGFNVDRDFFAFRCDDQVVCWEMAKAGFGIGFNQIQIGDREPAMVRIEIAGEVGSLPIWLAAHSELRSSPRVRFVFDFLADNLKEKTD